MAILPLSPVTENFAPVVKYFPQAAETSPVARNKGLWLKRVTILLAGVGLLVSSVTLGATAAPAPVPAPKVAIPPALDWQAEYQAQKICSSWAKPGAQRLSDLLAETYGAYTTYIIRSCATSGISEHEEGRAVDWMVNVRDPDQAAKAEAFLNWLTAPGPNGELGAMARRMGIMYLIWNDKMWRVYRPEDGWREYSGCSKKQSRSYDTYCHRDHIHVSLTWDGAYAATSFWTGVAETRGPCESSATERDPGRPDAPSTLMNTRTGAGLDQPACRLGASSSYASRSYQVTVPVPAVENPVQRIELNQFSLNAPELLSIKSADTVTFEQGAEQGQVFDVPLNPDGKITVTVGAGYGDVILRGMGNGEGAPLPPSKPAKLKLKKLAVERAHVNTPISYRGVVRRAPAGSEVKLQFRKAGKKKFRTRASASIEKGRHILEPPPFKFPGNFEVRTVLKQGKKQLAKSKKVRQLVIDPAKVTLLKPARSESGKRIKLSGVVAGAPAEAQLRVLHQKPKGYGSGKYAMSVRKEIPVANGEFQTALRVKSAGAHRFKVELVGGKKKPWAQSRKKKFRLRN